MLGMVHTSCQKSSILTLTKQKRRVLNRGGWNRLVSSKQDHIGIGAPKVDARLDT